ncbi:glycine cleavage system protein R [Jiangella rhizosphaerae]|uniref:ACT domain-containing protein n=1 Tax=Jiangella rhizosphaerae TaxID=2293569 RepID=A0A418KQ27_9ACTN|nr:ACT domain-containing protein [Jiangella rhizosphaerae]RIQ21376.1 ACT domain-containing protein [Jiangella rhizosphaerae]
MSLIAVTVIGHDRPGIIADATAGLAGLGLNLEDSTMTLLRGHFAMMLICSGDRSPGEVEEALAPLTADGRLQVSAAAVPDEDAADVLGRRPYVLTVHGGDRPGIVSAVTRVVAAAGGNITDLTTRLAGDLYVAVAEVDLPGDADADAVAGQLRDAGARLGVGVTLRPQETDVL